MGTLAAGIKEIFATAKTTGSNVMLCGNDGTPDGHINMANLASVLGGHYPLKYWNNSIVIGDTTSLDDLKTPGSYVVASSEFSWCSILVFAEDDSTTVFQIVTKSDGSFLKYRIYNNNAWYAWHDITFDLPSFYKDYANLSSLANALGGLQFKGALLGDVDLDSAALKQSGVWSLKSLSGTAATTLGFEFGVFVSIGGDEGIQIATELAWGGYSSNKVLLRVKWGGDSSPWRGVMFT